MSELFSSITGAITDTLNDGLQAILYSTIYKLLYYIETGLCWLLNMVSRVFEVLAGLTTVTYDGKKDFLINIFFHNSVVSNVYWGMALLGIVLSFVFAIIAVARKAVDSGDKIRQSLGGILTGLLKSILMIAAMSAVMIMLLDSTNVLMQRVSYLFDHAEDINKPEVVTYTNEEYAAMARVLNTIGNYSLNPSYQSRYNINSCYNDLRGDMRYLEQQGVFDVYYETKDAYGNQQLSWQSVLQNLAHSADLSRNLSMDVYNESVSNAILDIMNVLRNNANLYPLKSYQRTTSSGGSQTVPLDRVIFLMGTMSAAKNSGYNENPSVTDALRSPYYTGEKDIYDLDSVSADFDIGTATNYLLVYVCACVALWNLGIIILNCVARIFNMLLLYVIAPPMIAVTPLDEGAKTRQWMTAMVIQCFGVFANVISMRLVLLFIPIVMSAKLVLFDSAILNLFCKMVIVLGGILAVEKAGGIINGILADNAGMQAIHSGDMGREARNFMSGGLGMAAAVPGAAWGVAKGTASAAASTLSGTAGAFSSFGDAAAAAADALSGGSGGGGSEPLPASNSQMGGSDSGAPSFGASGGTGSGSDDDALPASNAGIGGADTGAFGGTGSGSDDGALPTSNAGMGAADTGLSNGGADGEVDGGTLTASNGGMGTANTDVSGGTGQQPSASGGGVTSAYSLFGAEGAKTVQGQQFRKAGIQYDRKTNIPVPPPMPRKAGSASVGGAPSGSVGGAFGGAGQKSSASGGRAASAYSLFGAKGAKTIQAQQFQAAGIQYDKATNIPVPPPMPSDDAAGGEEQGENPLPGKTQV